MYWKKKASAASLSALSRGLLADRYLHGISSDSHVDKSHRFLKKNDVSRTCLLQVRALDEIAQSRGRPSHRWRSPGSCAIHA